MEQQFDTSLGTSSKVITVILFLMGILTPLFSITIKNHDADMVWIGALLPGVFILLLSISYLYKPQSYLVTPKAIIIKRTVKSVEIPLDQIREVKSISEEEMGLALRLFGNGGVFGFTGYFFSGKMGRMRWYATRKNNYVLIVTKPNKKIILTPDLQQELVLALTNKMK